MFRQQLYQNMGLKKAASVRLGAFLLLLNPASHNFMEPPSAFNLRRLRGYLNGKLALRSMQRNHPFQNGNKRIAITTLFIFLYRNSKWLKVDTQELYNFTVWVAQSPRTVKEDTIKATEKFLKTHLVKPEK